MVEAKNGLKAKKVLENEFKAEFESRDVSKIFITDDVAVISVIGQSLDSFNQPFSALIKNQITPLKPKAS